MSVTMTPGSFIIGSTCIGGGAAAFPVMTLGFGMEQPVSVNFSLMIQSVGMVSALLVIVIMRVIVEWRAIVYASIGVTFGVIIGIELIALKLASSSTKIFLVSLWLGSGTALHWVNCNHA